VIFGSVEVSGGSRGNTSVFAGRNSSTPAFYYSRAFVGAIPVRSGGGVGCYSSRGSRGGGGGGVVRGGGNGIVGGSRGV